MKIAFVIPGAGGGGVRSVGRIAIGLAQRGHDVVILYRRARPGLRALARDSYLRLRYGHRNDWLRSFPGRTQPYDTLDAGVVGQNDIIVGVGVDCVLAVHALPASCGVKVHNCRGVEPWIEERMDRAWRLPMPRIVVSSHLVRAMEARGCTDPISIVHNGVDRTAYFPALTEDERLGVGTVYHGGGVKAPEVICEVFRKLQVSRPATPLYAFGTYPRPRALPQKVQYVRLPPLAVARELHSRARVWFCASYTEGFCNPLLEAMACGCAVVSTACGGPADFIEPGINGLLTPVGSADGLAVGIMQLLDDPVLRARIVAGSASVLERFTWDRAVTEFEAALRGIAARGAGAVVRHKAETVVA